VKRRPFITIPILCFILILAGCHAPNNIDEQTQQSLLKRVEPLNFSQPFMLETIESPKLADKSREFRTEEFKDLDGIFEDNYWNPLVFLDNENFLFIARLLGEEDYVYRYNLNTKQIQKLFRNYSFAENLFIKGFSNFGVAQSTALVVLKDDQLDKEIQEFELQEKQREFEHIDIVANPYNEKLVIKGDEKWYLTDLNFTEIFPLPFKDKDIYRACWADENNLLLGAFDDIEAREGSVILTYNIIDETTTETYIGDDKVFVDPYRISDDYCGFTFIDDNIGPPDGTIGIVDYTKNRVIFLRLDNAEDCLSLQRNWVAAVVANKPINWKEWGRTTKGKVNLVVYDVATDTYIIRAKNLPRSNNEVMGRNIIISPDGNTIIYHSIDKKHFINRKKQ